MAFCLGSIPFSSFAAHFPFSFGLLLRVSLLLPLLRASCISTVGLDTTTMTRTRATPRDDDDDYYLQLTGYCLLPPTLSTYYLLLPPSTTYHHVLPPITTYAIMP